MKSMVFLLAYGAPPANAPVLNGALGEEAWGDVVFGEVP
ncbi:exported hypothetical protein [Xanthomonas hortorum pv. vitians]|nr:exported hypothetical protein [Xanthomonas hortorum pv. vitians]